jgi:hypothetical protein
VEFGTFAFIKDTTKKMFHLYNKVARVIQTSLFWFSSLVAVLRQVPRKWALAASLYTQEQSSTERKRKVIFCFCSLHLK